MIYRLLVALALCVFVSQFSPNSGEAQGPSCVVADPTGTALNVRKKPQGAVINRLRNGRKVFVMDSRSGPRGKPWVKVGGYYKGDWRNWGWVFRPYLNCGESDDGERESKFSVASGDKAGQPIVFDRGVGMRNLGIALAKHGGSEVPSFNNKCYYYGDGGYDISISDEFLERYLRRGFTLNSLCLGLQSWMQFDPETGKRLPTYIVADVAALKSGMPDCCLVTDPLPLELPQCFSRGVPLHDCNFRFDTATGRPLSQREINKISRNAEAIENTVRTKLRQGFFKRRCRCGESSGSTCRVEKWEYCIKDGEEHGVYIRGRLAAELNFIATSEFRYGSFIDVSQNLPLGFGYALNADGTAAPSASLQSEKIALSSKNHSNTAKLRALKKLLSRSR